MSQQNELTMRPCIVCNKVGFTSVLLGESLADASDFRDAIELSTKFLYELATCKFCGHNSIQTDNPCLLPTRKHDFIKYGEPNEHYPKISKILGGLNLDFKDVSIHTFSYKDVQLANYLARDLNISNINLNDHAGCSDDWLPSVSSDGIRQTPLPFARFLNEIDNSKKSHQLILITRFFDHVANHYLLKNLLELSSPRRHIVFDLNDYDRLFKLGTVEFIWNERRNLFCRSHLESILQKNNLRYSMFAYESQEVSPTLTGVISERLANASDSDLRDIIKLQAPNLIEKLTALRLRWQDTLAADHKLGIIGASHKGVSLAQFVLGNGVQYSLHDDKQALKEKTPPVLPPLGFHSVSGFDFSKYTHIAITTTLVIAAKIIPKLRASGYTGEILDFDCKRLD